MKNFMKWDGKVIEDDGCDMSKEAKSFVAAFKNMIKRETNPDECTIKAGHYYLSGHLVKGDKICYVSYYIPRYGDPVNFSDRSANGHVLIRTAKSITDYTGGPNHFCSIKELPVIVNHFFMTGQII